jgi:hypothetical protein
MRIARDSTEASPRSPRSGLPKWKQVLFQGRSCGGGFDGHENNPFLRLEAGSKPQILIQKQHDDKRESG